MQSKRVKASLCFACETEERQVTAHAHLAEETVFLLLHWAALLLSVDITETVNRASQNPDVDFELLGQIFSGINCTNLINGRVNLS